MAVEFARVLDPLIEWVYEQAGENPLADSSILPFAHERGMEDTQAYELLRYGESKGLLDGSQSSMGEPRAMLTSYGLEVMEERKRRRSSPAARSAAARKALLVWLWRQKHDGTHFPLIDKILKSDDSLFAGDRLTLSEMDRAAGYLLSKNLIRGTTKVSGREGPIRAEITTEGLDCVEHYEGDISAYERRNNGGNTTFHIGENTGNIAANSRDFTMNATTNKDGIDPAAVVMLARALRQATPALELPEDDALEFTQLATRLETEATGGSPDPGRLQRWGGSIVAILNSPVVSGALGSVLAAYTGTVLPGLPAA
ncbi:hypothetical protein [Streptomyces sp. NPDC058622]|uniref:hypothetical protein n=1 Tax=Streptomyces sp. NPDC058622 TaxID=3346562 RepID=UPI0036699711